MLIVFTVGLLGVLFAMPTRPVAAQSVSSLNPNVPCSAAVTTLQNITTTSGGLSGSPWQVNSTGGGVPSKRALSPPCTIINKNGQAVSTLVQINGIYFPSLIPPQDCLTSYASVNGGGLYPNSNLYCDSTSDIHPISGNGTIHIEFDRDWIAKGYCGPGHSPCDNATIRQYISSGSISLDVQGFVYWDIDHWELHPFTAWKLSFPSWNSNVACGANPVTIQNIMGSSYPSQSLSGSPYQTSSTTGGVPNKRALSPPCTLTNTSGQVVSSFVQISGVYLTNYFYETRDCNTSYDAVNGGGPFPNGKTLCDSTGNIFAVGTTNVGTNYVHIEIDRDWMAKGYCGPSTGFFCDNSTIIQPVCTIASPCSSTRSIDVQGFVFWDTEGHWELHPFTAWKLSSSLATGFTNSPPSPSAGSQVTFTASPTGGTPPYTSNWNFGDGATAAGSTVTHSYAVKGSYTATLTTQDSAGAIATASNTVTVSPQALTVSVSCGPATAGTSVTCAATASGGTSPYTFSWASKGTPATGTGSSYTTTFASKGSQTVNATATDINGVSKLGQATISVAAQPIVVTVTCGTATAGKPVTCNASATGGTAPFTFAWASKGTPATGTGSSYTTTFATKGSQIVNATATDLNGVSKLGQATVTVTAQPIVVIVTCGTATAGKPVTCNASATGGTSPFTFSWASKGTPATGTGSSYTTTFASKGSQVVNATATDLNGVSKVGQATVSVTAQPIVVTVTCGTASAGKPVTCNASATGGTAPFTFSWASRGTPATGTGSSYTTTFASKGSQTVNATATDLNGVSKLGQATVSIAAQPIVVTVTCGTATAGKPVTCNASATGGTAPFTFLWASKGTPATGTGSSYTTTFASKGSQVVNATATDLNSVSKLGQATVSVAAQPIVVTVTCGTATAGKPVICNASATGGTSPYTFFWSAPGGSPSSGTGPSYTTTYATKGAYIINATATDANSAKNSAARGVLVAAQSIGFSITDPPGLTAGKPISFTSNVVGGTGPYTIVWSAPNGSPASASGQSFTTTYATKGTFVVNATVTDANGGRRSTTLTVVVASQPLSVVVTCGSATVGKPVICSASTSGGTPPFTFSWASKGSPATGTGTSYITTFGTKGSQTVNATATDLNGVSKLGQATISVTAQPIVVTVTCGTATAGKPVTCNASATGGTAPFTFTWASKGIPATGTGSSYTTTFSTKGSQTVNATAADLNGVSKLGQATVSVTAQPIVVTVTCGTATAGKPVTCNASATGGTAPFSFSWASKGTPATGTGSSYATTFATKGSQTINATATDLNGVSKLGQATVSVTAQPIIVTVTCGTATAGKPVTCNASATGGTSPYTFVWASKGTPSTGTGSSYATTFASKGSQVVNATATDLNGVSKLGQATVSVTAQPIIVTVTCGTATSGKPVTCNASATGGTAPFTFSWASKGTPATGTGSSYTTTFASKGSQTVNATATDLNGVSKLGQATVSVSAQPIVVTVTCGTATAGKPVTCNASATGGTAPFTISWASKGTPAPGTGTSYTTTFSSTGSQTVNATATDMNGVSKLGQAIITVQSQNLVITASCPSGTAGKPVTCQVSLTGGVAPYTVAWSSVGTPSSFAQTTSKLSNYTVTFASKGSFTVKTNVTDSATPTHNTSSTTTTAVISAQPIAVSVTCGTATAGKPVTCNSSATGGTPPYTFSWSSGGSPASGTGLSYTTTFAIKGPQSVNATATDLNGVSKLGQATVSVTAQPIIVTVTCGTATSGKPVTCNASATGGTAPFTFTWASKGTPSTGTGSSYATTFSSSGSQTINATAMDLNGVSKLGQTTVGVTTQPIVVTVTCGTATAGKPAPCNASATGGTPPYTFTWASKGSPSTGTGSSYTTTFASKGSQTVNATATDLNGVSKLGQATVSVTAQPLVVTVTCGSATAGKPVTCNASVSGGTSPFTFTWNVDGVNSTATSGPSFTTTFAAKGTHSIKVFVKDGNGAGAVSSPVSVVVAGQTLSVSASCGTATAGKPVTCNASATGGTAPFTFSWASKGTPATGTGSSYTTTFASKGFQTVNATATDLNGVSKLGQATVSVTAQPIVVTVTCGTATAGKSVTCNASATGGTPPYTFSWASKGSPAAGTGSSYTTTFSSSQAGSQTINATVTDLNGVSKLGQATITVQVQGLVIMPTCPSGTAGKPITCGITVTGGTPPYTVVWSSAGTPSTLTIAGSATQSKFNYTVTFASKGMFTVNANVTDSATPTHATSSGSTTAVIGAQPTVVTVTCGSATAGKPVTCNASATGGTPPYTFSWASKGSPATGTGSSYSTTFASKGTQTVNVTVTDGNGVTKLGQAAISVAAQPIAVTVTCGSATAGKPVTCNASAMGGTPPYAFTWASKGSPSTGTGSGYTTTFASKGSQTINATVTDTNGVSKLGQATVSVTAQPIVVTVACGAAAAGKPVTCNASATGGTPPYTFTWASKGSPSTGTGSSYTTTFASKGSQTVNTTATDLNGVSKLGQATISVAAQPIVVTVTCGTATAGKPVSCNASATGGTPPYTFSWASKGSPATGTGASYTTTFSTKGSQTVNATATDLNGVSKLGQASISVVAQPIVVTVSCGTATIGKPVTCNASATGGTAPFTFSWASKGTPATGTGSSYTTTFASKGSQVVNATATDLNSVSKLGQATVSVAAQPIVVTVTCGTATAGKPVTCNASATGGTTPFTFSWASRGTPATGSGSSYTTTFATKGSQTVNATATDLNSVSKLGQATVSVAAQPIVVNVTCGTATAGKPVTCNASATGGTAPFTFTWASKGTPATGTGSSYTTTFASKGSQVVNATAKDLNNVSQLGQATVIVAAQPIIVTVTCGTATAGKPVTCNASATGGTAPFAFSWASKGTPATGTGSSYTTTFATKGSQTVNATATDLNGVSKLGQATVSVTAQPIVVTVTCGTATAGKPVTCNASATSGTAPYSFTWASNGSPATGTGSSYMTTFSTVGSQTVNVTATDLNGVSKLGQTTINVQSQQLIVTATCPGGTAGKPITCTSSVTSGIPPYTVVWSSAGTPSTFTGTGAKVNYTVTFVSKGMFAVKANVTDSSTPTHATSSTTTTAIITAQPTVVTVTCGTATAGKPVACNASATGGTAPYTFSWASKGSPATGTGSSYTTTFATKGSQTVNATATDLNGVSKLGQATVSVAAQPIVVAVTCGTATAGKPVTCNASATGGTAPFTFTWASKGTPATGTGSSYTTTFASKGSQVVNATATDLNGVSKLGQATVSVTAQPIVVTVTCGTATAGKPVTCNASATGGTAPFTFSWASKGTPATGTGSSYTTTFASKGSQTVNATATDLNGVSKLGQATVSVTAQPIVVTVTCGTATAGKPVTCNASATGGTAPFTFSWASKGTPATGTSSSYTTTFAVKGSQVVNATATDLNGVSKLGQATVSVTAQPIVVTVTCGTATAGKPVTCNVSVTGGTSPYAFSWSAPGGSPSTGSGNSFTTIYAAKGTFVVNATATDTNNVKQSQTATIIVAGQPIIVTVACGTATAGTLVTCTASATGGTAPYTYIWASKGTPATGTGSSYTTTFATKGSQVVNATAKDLNNISKLGQATINVAAQPVVVTVTCGTATAGKPVTCNASAAGGTSPYTFSWSAPGGSPAMGTGASFTTIYSTKGTYVVNVTATDVNNVKKSAIVSVVVSPQPLAASAIAIPAVGTAGQLTVFSGASSGGTAPYMFSWGFGDNSLIQLGSSVTHVYSAAGNYSVVLNVTDANSATVSLTQIYRVGAPLPLNMSLTTPSLVVATRPGNFTATASGGVGPYTFSWSFGDNATGTGVSVQHSYSIAPKNYTVSVRVTDSKGTTRTVSNRVLVWQTPDLDGDGKVDLKDVAQVAFAFDAKLGDSNYDPRADLDGDGRVDILDAAVVAAYFGTTGW